MKKGKYLEEVFSQIQITLSITVKNTPKRGKTKSQQLDLNPRALRRCPVYADRLTNPFFSAQFENKINTHISLDNFFGKHQITEAFTLIFNNRKTKIFRNQEISK